MMIFILMRGSCRSELLIFNMLTPGDLLIGLFDVIELECS